MPEPELTPEIAAGLFGRKATTQAAPIEQAGEQEQETSTEQPQGSRDELTEDQLELASRHNLSAQEVKRVRGKTWAEKNEDAQRLAAILEARPNRGEIAALEANKYEQQQQRIVDLFHPPPKSEGGVGS